MARPKHQTILSLAPDAVDRDEKGRIGIYFPLKAQALAHLIGQDGQHDPIKVRASTGSHKWKLVAGLHRLEACAIAGVKVKAIQVSGDARVIAEIQASENIHRRILCPIERACFIHAIGNRSLHFHHIQRFVYLFRGSILKIAELEHPLQIPSRDSRSVLVSHGKAMSFGLINIRCD